MSGFRRSAAVVVAALVVSALALAGSSAGQPGERQQVRVILELAAPPALDAAAGETWARAEQRAGALADAHRGLVDRARDGGLDVEAVHDLTAAFNGLVADVPTDQVDDLGALPGVAAVHRDAPMTTTLDVSVPHVGAPAVWEQRDPPARGAGVVVAVIDTGIDYTRPELGGGFGPGHRVVGGHDFVNRDGDPIDDHGHGTHVAGIVGADGDDVTGVAPEVSFTAYKVFNRSGSGSMADVLAAFDAAVAPDNPHRADVVNLSLSGPGDGADPLSQAANAAIEAGVVVVASAGNSGPDAQTIASPGSAERVLTVGASTTGLRVPEARLVAPVQRDLGAVRRVFSANPPADALELEVVDIGRGTPGAPGTPDVNGKAVLMQYMGDEFDLDRSVAAEAAGAPAALFYLTDTWGPVQQGAHAMRPAAAPAPEGHAFAAGADEGRLDKIVVMLLAGPSAALIAEHGAAARVAITATDATDELASFSSRGPSGLFGAKPDLVAPGVEIRSLRAGGGRLRVSGTSMAAPHVAGAAALLRQLHPDWSADVTMAALTGSAQPLPDAPVLEHGAGRLDVLAASQASVVALPRALSFPLAGGGERTLSRTLPLTLRNLSAVRRRARLSVRPEPGSRASLTVSRDRVDVPAKGSVTVTARMTLSIPRGDVDESGAVVVDVAEGVDLRIPYALGVRHLNVRATPDPVPADTETSILVSTRAELPAPPTVRVDCPGAPPYERATQPDGTRIWHVRAEVDRAGVCEVTARARADARYGSPELVGETAFEVAAPPRPGSSSWRPIGPNGESGRFTAFDAGEPGHMAVIADNRISLFLTENGGDHWRRVRTMPLAGGAVRDVAVDPRDGDRIYVAVRGAPFDASYAGRVLLTEDGGRSWRILPAPDARFDAIDLAPSGALAIAGAAGVLVTTDDFATSRQLPTPWSTLYDLSWVGPDLYAGTTSGLQRFRDGSGQPERLFDPPVLPWVATVTGDERTLLVDSYFDGLYVSRDGGNTFNKLFDAPGFPRRFLDLELIGDDIIGVTLNSAWIGHDRGARWEPWGDPIPAAVEWDVKPQPDGTGIFVSALAGGIFAADTPGSFERIGLPAADVLDIAVARDASGADAVLAGSPSDTYRKVLAGGPPDLEWGMSGWEGFTGATAQFLSVSPGDPSVVWKVRSDFALTFGIYRSEDGGRTWKRTASPNEFANALLVHPADPDQVFVANASLTGSGLVVTRDGGRTWRRIYHGRNFTALAGDPADPQRIWAGDVEGLWLSEDGGHSFRRVLDEQVTAIAIDPRDRQRIVVGGRRLLVSRDGGRRFRAADHTGLDLWVSDIVFGRSRTVYASTTAFYDEVRALVGGRGVLRSTDGGEDWSPLGRGLESPDVTSLALTRDGDRLLAGTLGGSVHSLSLEDGGD